jgi:small nuclear ribonucleoprotein (snRNP)-like protein
MRRSPLFVLLAVLCASVCASAAVADQVTLKNGDRLSGSVVSSDGKTLLLKTDYAGEVTIKWDAVSSIESSQNLTISLKDGKRLSGKVSTNDGLLVAGAGSAPKDAIVAVRNDAEQKAADEQAEKLAHPRFYYFWNGVFDTGLALTRGNSATASYTLNTTAVRQTARDKVSLFATYIYANDDSTPPSRTTASSLRSGARLDWNLTERVFVFGFGDFETNELQHLSLRQVYGGGFGYHIIKTDRNSLDVFGGFDYDRDKFAPYSLVNPAPPPPLTPIAGRAQNSAEATVGEEFNSKFSKRGTLTQTFSLFPNVSHTGDFRYQFDATMATQVKAWMNWQVTFSDHYINYPPPGLKSNDIVLSTGLRVVWGKPSKF